jgi:hypothetical protein
MTSSGAKIHRTLPVLAMLALAGCASAPPPTLQLDAAEVALAGAREVRAERFAPDELRLARIRLEEAQAAMARGKYDEARQLAEQAEAEASLAIARSRAAAWRAEVEQKTEQNASLRRSLLGEGRQP